MVKTVNDKNVIVFPFAPDKRRIELDLGPAYVVTERPAAKSSTSVLKATVCQICGHPFDGRKNASRTADGRPCGCYCHKGA